MRKIRKGGSGEMSRSIGVFCRVARTGVVRTSLVLALATVGLIVAAQVAQADTFTFTSCHLTGGCGTATSFGTVTLLQSGTSVTFDVVLNSGNRFVETGAGGGALFIFNDT